MKCAHTQCNRHECAHTKPLRKVVLPNRLNSCWVPYLGAMPPMYPLFSALPPTLLALLL